MSPPIHLGVMQVELDHLFVCTAAGGPEAQRLLQFGLNEAPPNVHPGQGTANRRFAFSNAMIELLWVDNPAEAQSQATARTLLWERWSRRSEGSCPFGICVRPVDIPPTAPPFPGWEYRPVYLPPPLSMHIGEAGVEEPMWVYLNFITRTQRQKWFPRAFIGHSRDNAGRPAHTCAREFERGTSISGSRSCSHGTFRGVCSRNRVRSQSEGSTDRSRAGLAGCLTLVNADGYCPRPV